jgi:ActR/RegA family two-component response regulator
MENKKPEKVLIADDDFEYQRSLMQTIFRNYEVDLASDADQEIEKARGKTYTLILTDNQMEDGHENSGLYAIEQIRKYDKETPIYLHSGELTDQIRTEALKLGANGVFKKEDDFRELEKILTQLKGSKRKWD